MSALFRALDYTRRRAVIFSNGIYFEFPTSEEDDMAEKKTPEVTRCDQLRVQAAEQFGVEPAHGLFDKLVEKYGDWFAELIMKWLLDKIAGRTGVAMAPAGASASVLSNWVADLIDAHEDEILALVTTQARVLLRAGSAALREGTGPVPA